MTEIMNFNDCALSRKNGIYGGAAGKKHGIILNGEQWMVKYPKNISDLEGTGGASYSTTPLSEYIGSHIYEILGYDVHETLLGERQGKIVVACKDFATDADLLEIRTIKNYADSEFADLLERKFPNSDSTHMADIDELLLLLESNQILSHVSGAKERFWEQAVIDIFINNNDRNNGNWGILRGREGEDRLAPVFDNGGSFQNKISESRIDAMLQNVDNVKKNAFNMHTAYGIDGHSLSAARFLDLFKNHEDLQKAVTKVVPNISQNLSTICKFINNIPETYCGEENKNYLICSANRKKLFTLQLQARFESFLLPYHNEVMKIMEENMQKPDECRKVQSEKGVGFNKRRGR